MVEYTDRQFAAFRARRTMAVNELLVYPHPEDQAELKAIIANYDAILMNAPVKPEKIPADRSQAAVRAWITMVNKQLKGTRGKKRAALKEKLASLELKLVA